MLYRQKRTRVYNVLCDIHIVLHTRIQYKYRIHITRIIRINYNIPITHSKSTISSNKIEARISNINKKKKNNSGCFAVVRVSASVNKPVKTKICMKYHAMRAYEKLSINIK